MAGASNDSIAPAKYILTILCLFTRFVIAIPIASKSAHDVSEVLFNYAFASHGRPLSTKAKNLSTPDSLHFTAAGT
jgi:uncharacterized membrane protein YciS (DUF1049 family)